MSKRNSNTRNRMVKTTMKEERQRRAANRRQTGGTYDLGLRSLSFTAGAPGTARLRGAFEVGADNTPGHVSFRWKGSHGFEDWCSQAYGILSPFAFFRVAEVAVRMEVAGGASSDNTIIFNISNNSSSFDNTAVGILDDDYAAVSNASRSPTLHPSKEYWRQGGRTWYACTDVTTPTVPIQDVTAGIISYQGTGTGTLPGPIAGWCIVDMVLQFHTLS